MDHITLGGLAAMVTANVTLIKDQGTTIGLAFSEKKHEIITTEGHTDEISLQQFI